MKFKVISTIFIIYLFKLNTQASQFTGQTGIVKGNYKAGTEQTFKIKVTNGAKVFIKWSKFGLDGRMPDCSQNYVEVVTGGCSTQAFIMTRFCQRSGEGFPNDIYSMDNCITINLYTDFNNYMNNSQIGFELSYHELPSTLSTACLIKDRNNILHTPNWPQPYKLASGMCKRNSISIPANHAMKIFVMSVDTESTSINQCNSGHTDTLYMQSPWGCGEYHTEWNNDGDGHTIYLDRHNIYCQHSQIITDFKLEHNDANQYRYEYKCCPARGTCNYIHKVTTVKEPSDLNKPIYLRDHNINCGSNSYLSRFRLVRDGKKKIHYNYTCCEISTPVLCQEMINKETEPTDKTYYLSKQDVTCSGAGIGLQQFELSTRSFKRSGKKKPKTKWSYKYKCCHHSSPEQRTSMYCGTHHLPSIVELPKGTPDVNFEFVEQSLVQNNKSGILLGYTLYDAQPVYNFGEKFYLIPYDFGSDYIAEYLREGGQGTDTNFKELHKNSAKENLQKFQIVPGLSGCEGCVSFRSIYSPYEYILAINDEALFATKEHALKSKMVTFDYELANYASFKIRTYTSNSDFVAFEVASRPGDFLFLDGENLVVRQATASDINSGARFRLATADPVTKDPPDGPPAEKPYWIIPVVLVATVCLSLFVKSLLIKRHVRAETRIRDYHKKLLNGVPDHPSSQTNEATETNP